MITTRRVEAGHRVPVWLTVLLAPLVGGAALLLLPVAGGAVVAVGLAQKALAGGRRLATELSHALATRPAVGRSHLTGPAPGAPGQAPGSSDAGDPGGDGLDEVEAAVRARQAEDRKAREPDPRPR
jgi:hypothetical protein